MTFDNNNNATNISALSLAISMALSGASFAVQAEEEVSLEDVEKSLWWAPEQHPDLSVIHRFPSISLAPMS